MSGETKYKLERIADGKTVVWDIMAWDAQEQRWIWSERYDLKRDAVAALKRRTG